jgi:predicted phosphodiesterase
MTRVAILADIHGNLPALEAVIDDITQLSPDLVVVGGDIVNRGPQSRECLAAVRALGWPAVFGNHEELVLKFEPDERTAELETDWWLPTRRVWEELSDEELLYLRAMPWFHVIRVPGLPAIRVVHGSARYLNEGLGFWMTDDELLAAVQDAPEPIVIGAHTHRPFERRVDGRWAMNTGAVGAPFNGDPSAQYLLLSDWAGGWEVEFRMVPYDRTPVYDAWERTGYMDRSVIANIFKYEVESATFHLMAYMRYCEHNDLELNAMSSFRHYRRATAHVLPGRSLKHR